MIRKCISKIVVINASSNDWWASGIEQNAQGESIIKVAYRYGGGGNAPMMEALHIYLQWVVN